MYRGDLLDGFHIADAGEFERWVEEERASLHREVLRALERLAKHGDEAANHPEAIRWWRRLAELTGAEWGMVSAGCAAGLNRGSAVSSGARATDSPA